MIHCNPENISLANQGFYSCVEDFDVPSQCSYLQMTHTRASVFWEYQNNFKADNHTYMVNEHNFSVMMMITL